MLRERRHSAWLTHDNFASHVSTAEIVFDLFHLSLGARHNAEVVTRWNATQDLDRVRLCSAPPAD